MNLSIGDEYIYKKISGWYIVLPITDVWPITPMVVSSVMALLKIGGKKLVILNCGVQQD